MVRPRSLFDVRDVLNSSLSLNRLKPAVCTACLLFALINPVSLRAVSGPVPFISEISPIAVAPGGPDFTLTVRGTSFINGQSTIFWNGAALPDLTTCTAANTPQLAFCTVTVRAAMIATAATANVTVVNSASGGASNVAFLPITNPTANVGLSSTGLSAGSNPGVVVVGDFNGDGKLDVVVASDIGLTLMLGNGDGTFTPKPVVAPVNTIGNISSMAVGDFNGDGKLDIAGVSGESTFVILLGNGDGTFSTTRYDFNPPLILQNVATGDFNGDGKLDLVFTGSSRAVVYLGNGDGTFTFAYDPIVPGGGPQPVVVGDFNGDGKPDLALLNYCGTDPNCGVTNGNVTILLGDGTGNFVASASSPVVGLSPRSMVAADFNGDGILDLAVLNNCGNGPECNSGPTYSAGSITILLGNGDGTFTPTSESPTTAYNPSKLLVGDLTGDGKLDLAVAIGSQAGPPLIIFPGDGTGNFSTALNTPVPPIPSFYPPSGAIGDFNGDGRLDMVFASSQVYVFLQAPDLTISMTHTGNFTQGQTGAVYTIIATNNGSVSPSGLVTVTDTLPVGLTAMAMSGTGWDCSANSFPVVGNGTTAASCTRTDALAPGESYPAITLTANLAVDAPASFTNTAAISGGGDGNTSNNTATDPTIIVTYNVLIPSSVSFTDQVVGTTSGAETETLNMSGTGTLNISGIAVSGDFAQTNNCGATVGSGTTCTLNVTFTPTATGLRTGFITISDNSPTSPQTIALSGTGVQPAVTLSLTSLTFGSQFVGNVGLPQNFSVTNSGTSALNISSVVASSGYGDSVGCNSPVPPGSSCSISVFFDPAASGSVSGTLTITDDAPGSPHTVALSGTGQDFSLATAGSTSPTASVAQGSTASYTLTLAPSGGFTKPVAFTCTGAPLKSVCNVNPAVVTLSPTSPTPILVTVTTTASSTGLPLGAPRPTVPGPPAFMAWWWMAAVLAGMLIACARSVRGRVPLRVACGTAILLVAMLGVFAMPGCGGTMVQPPAVTNVGTPSGTYTLNVTGTFSTGTTTLSHSVQLTLTVH